MGSLESAGYRPVRIWTRGGYTGPFNAAKSLVRKLLGKRSLPSSRDDQRARMFAKSWIQTAWITLAMFDLILVYGCYFRWLRLAGRTVIADRYLWDTWIDFILNFPNVKFDLWPLWKLLKIVTPHPHHSFLLLIPVEESVRRSKLKSEPFPDSEDVLRLRLQYYEKLGLEMGWKTIQCSRPIAEIAAEITGHVIMPESNTVR